jgi:glycosyltransferase involved in cell wall biosynthesis
MASGTPVITSTTSSLPEVAGDAAITVEPTDASALANALRAILSDGELRRRMRSQGMARAAEFTWERTAEQMKQVFCDAVELRRRSRP